MDYKGVQYELCGVDALDDFREFSEVSPFGRVPVLLTSGQPISESMAIAEYIEETAPTPALLGSSPLERARVREICEAVNSSIHPVQNSSVVRYFHPSCSKDDMRSLRAEWIEGNLCKLNGRLWRSGQFAVGHSFTLADIFVAVIFKKAEALGSSLRALAAYDAHWNYLMSVPTVRSSCPLAAATQCRLTPR